MAAALASLPLSAGGTCIGLSSQTNVDSLAGPTGPSRARPQVSDSAEAVRRLDELSSLLVAQDPALAAAFSIPARQGPDDPEQSWQWWLNWGNTFE